MSSTHRILICNGKVLRWIGAYVSAQALDRKGKLLSDLIRPVTDTEIRTFWEDGFVCLRGVISQEWLSKLEAAVDEVLAGLEQAEISRDLTKAAAAARAQGGGGLGGERSGNSIGRFLATSGAWNFSPKARAFDMQSPLPEIAGQLLRSDVVRFYDDQVLVKEPDCAEYSPFHTDEGYWKLTGDQVLAIWASADLVTEETGAMRYVRGSHLMNDLFHARDFATGRDVVRTSGGEYRDTLDVESHEEDFDIVTLPVEPGDIIAHHYRTIHGSKGNYSTMTQRRATSVRYCGDDVRYKDKPGGADKTYHGIGHLRDGEPLDDSYFPIVWRRDTEPARSAHPARRR